jgi:hypothetical protein
MVVDGWDASASLLTFHGDRAGSYARSKLKYVYNVSVCDWNNLYLSTKKLFTEIKSRSKQSFVFRDPGPEGARSTLFQMHPNM